MAMNYEPARKSQSDMNNHQEEAVLIRFFPGLQLSDARQVGRVNFWSFPDQIDEYLPDWAWDRARQFAEFFKDNHGQPLVALVCATVQEPAEAEEPALLNQEISYAADILCYTEQASPYGSSSIRIDHFDSHPFVIPGAATSDVVVFDGLGHRAIVGLGANFNYYLPPFMRRESLNVRIDEPLLHALGISLERWRQAEAGSLQQSEITEDRRMLRAIGWYNQSGFRYSRHSPETLVLHAATALEALLDLPRGGTTDAFRNSVALLLGENAELRRWCGEFYNVRSRIIHGDETPTLLYGSRGQRPHLSHLDFSRKVFEQCLISLLANRCRLPYDPLVISAIRAMTIASRLISNQQRLQEIVEMEASQVLSDPDTTERFRSAIITIDYYETNSVTIEACKAAIEKISEILIRMCENILTAGGNDVTIDFVRDLQLEIQRNQFTRDYLLNSLIDLDNRHQQSDDSFTVSGLPLRVVVDGLFKLVDIRDMIS